MVAEQVPVACPARQDARRDRSVDIFAGDKACGLDPVAAQRGPDRGSRASPAIKGVSDKSKSSIVIAMLGAPSRAAVADARPVTAADAPIPAMKLRRSIANGICEFIGCPRLLSNHRNWAGSGPATTRRRGPNLVRSRVGPTKPPLRSDRLESGHRASPHASRTKVPTARRAVRVSRRAGHQLRRFSNYRSHQRRVARHLDAAVQEERIAPTATF